MSAARFDRRDVSADRLDRRDGSAAPFDRRGFLKAAGGVTAGKPLGPWTYRGRILDTVTNTTTNHSAMVEYKGQWYIVYHNGMLPGGGEFRRSVCIDKLFFNEDGTIQKVVQTLSPRARQPVAWYRFDERSGTTAADSAGGNWPGTLAGGATFVRTAHGGALRLNGTDGHVSLPAGIVWNMYDFTLAGWVKLTAADGHLVDFGTGTTAYMYLTPGGASGPVRFAITTSGVTREQRVDGTAALPTGRWTHVAVTKSALVATLYVNGVQVGQNTNLGLYPARLGNTPNNWIGPGHRGDQRRFRRRGRGSARRPDTGRTGDRAGAVGRADRLEHYGGHGVVAYWSG
ncbi:MAG TPA: LamG-like jellyroll fold domain-containing protein [Streptosporangiaceae bacterium]